MPNAVGVVQGVLVTTGDIVQSVLGVAGIQDFQKATGAVNALEEIFLRSADTLMTDDEVTSSRLDECLDTLREIGRRVPTLQSPLDSLWTAAISFETSSLPNPRELDYEISKPYAPTPDELAAFIAGSVGKGIDQRARASRGLQGDREGQSSDQQGVGQLSEARRGRRRRCRPQAERRVSGALMTQWLSSATTGAPSHPPTHRGQVGHGR